MFFFPPIFHGAIIFPQSLKYWFRWLYLVLGVLGFGSWLRSQLLLSVNDHLERQQLMQKVLGSMMPYWERRIEIMVQAPGFGLTEPKYLGK